MPESANMNVYKFSESKIKRLNETLDSPYIWASSVINFNDPFEFKVAFDWSKESEETMRRYFEDNPASSEDEFQQWFHSLTDNNKWFQAISLRQALVNELALCCFTKDFNNHLLWSHYAKNHEGFCIEFDISCIQEVTGFLCQGPVKYSKKKPVFNPLKGSKEDSINSLLALVVFNKSESWSYEEEFRVVFKTPGKKILAPNSIKRVFIGCRASNELKDFARENQGKNGVHFFQMCEKPFDYELIPEIIEKNRIHMSSFLPLPRVIKDTGDRQLGKLDSLIEKAK